MGSTKHVIPALGMIDLVFYTGEDYQARKESYI